MISGYKKADFVLFSVKSEMSGVKKERSPELWILGIGLMTVSAISFSINGVLIKWAFNLGYKSMEIYVMRQLSQLILTILATFVHKDKHTNKLTLSAHNFMEMVQIEKKYIKWVVLRGIAAAFSVLIYTLIHL